MYELGKRIKERRESLNMTQEELASKMGYKTKSTITRIENGDNDIPSAKIKKFADILKCNPGWLTSIDSKNNYRFDDLLYLIDNFNDEQLSDLTKYAKYLKNQNRKEE